MEQRKLSQWASWALIGVVCVLWAWRPQHPLALRLLVDVSGVVVGIAWLASVATWLRNGVGWLRWVRGGGLRMLGANVTLRSATPLLVCLAGFAAIAFLVARIA
jgi:hypothetical protein